MTGEIPTPPTAPENPLEAVFEKAVQPFDSNAAITASLPAGAPVIRMRKADELPTETRELGGGGSITVPVLAALKNSKVAEWHRAGAFDFTTLKHDEIALVFLESAEGPADIKVVTRAGGDVLLVADLGGMLDALKAMVDNPAFKAFPGGEFLVEALRTGIESAKQEVLAALSARDASGKSLLDAFRSPSEP